MNVRARKTERDRAGRTRATAPAARPSPTTPRSGWAGLLLVALTVVVFAPSLNGQFLWDDDAHVTRPELRSVEGLARIWSEPGATQQYYPLLHTAFWVQYRLWGDAVMGYHMVSVLLHAISAILLLLILRRLEVEGAWLAAVIFVVHPVQVESVAWISEQKNALSLVFFLAALLAYLHYDDTRRPSAYAVAAGLFLGGLLTKTVVATLPGALLVIIWWKRGRLVRRDIVPLLPWFLVGGAAGLGTAAIERSMLGAGGSVFSWSIGERFVLAGRVTWFYLATLLWPSNLLFVYPRWHVSAAWPWPLVPLSILAVVFACWSVRNRWRAPLAVALLYLGTLFPALGFVNVYPFVFSFVADHFVYLPSIAIIVAVSAAVARLSPPVHAGWLRVVAVAIAITLGVLTWRQCQTYASAETLYRITLEGNPACYLCLNNLGTLAVARGDIVEARGRFEEALRIEPGSAETHNNLANLLVERGELPGAIAQYQQSLAIAPRNVIARTNLGIALVRAGRLTEARREFERTLQVMPGYAPAAQNLALLDRLGVPRSD